MSVTLALLGASGCVAAGTGTDEGTVLLTVENQTGAEIWYFQYAVCGSDQWIEVIAGNEYVPDGAFVSSAELYPGCYDMYVEDEFACVSQISTGGLAGGLEFTWTVYLTDLYCYYPG